MNFEKTAVGGGRISGLTNGTYLVAPALGGVAFCLMSRFTLNRTSAPGRLAPLASFWRNSVRQEISQIKSNATMTMVDCQNRLKFLADADGMEGGGAAILGGALASASVDMIPGEDGATNRNPGDRPRAARRWGGDKGNNRGIGPRRQSLFVPRRPTLRSRHTES